MLTLASVEDESDAGVSTPHGMFTATMVEADASTQTAAVSVTF